MVKNKIFSGLSKIVLGTAFSMPLFVDKAYSQGYRNQTPFTDSNHQSIPFNAPYSSNRSYQPFSGRVNPPENISYNPNETSSEAIIIGTILATLVLYSMSRADYKARVRPNILKKKHSKPRRNP